MELTARKDLTAVCQFKVAFFHFSRRKSFMVSQPSELRSPTYYLQESEHPALEKRNRKKATRVPLHSIWLFSGLKMSTPMTCTFSGQPSVTSSYEATTPKATKLFAAEI